MHEKIKIEVSCVFSALEEELLLKTALKTANRRFFGQFNILCLTTLGRIFLLPGRNVVHRILAAVRSLTMVEFAFRDR